MKLIDQESMTAIDPRLHDRATINILIQVHEPGIDTRAARCPART